LHSLNLIHRDIRPENIVMYKDGRVKICDLETVKELVCSSKTSLMGTIQYQAPEFKYGNYDNKVDVWSFGMILLLWSTGKQIDDLHRWIDRDVKESLKHVKDEEIRDICEKCLKKDPSERISSETLSSLVENSYWGIFFDCAKYLKFTFENDQQIKKYCENELVHSKIKENFNLIPTIEDKNLKELMYRFILNGKRFEEERNLLFSNQKELESIPHLIFLYYRDKDFVKGSWIILLNLNS
jgi:serine/threonine protein kinase